MRTFKLLLFLLIFAVPAMADSIYDVTGALTIVGNDVCGGVPCVETLAFSFQVTYYPVFEYGSQYYAATLADTRITSFGPLTFTYLAWPFAGSGTYMAFGNAAGDEIDIFPTFAAITGGPFGLYAGAQLYSCGTDFAPDSVCVRDFSPYPTAPCCVLAGGPLEATVTAVTPEGSTISYLLIGFLFAFGLSCKRRHLSHFACAVRVHNFFSPCKLL